jgi:hypothetical protein
MLPIRKAYRHNSIAAFAKAEIAFLRFGAMSKILGDNASRIIERKLGFGEANPVLDQIRQILCGIPLEAGLGHDGILS